MRLPAALPCPACGGAGRGAVLWVGWQEQGRLWARRSTHKPTCDQILRAHPTLRPTAHRQALEKRFQAIAQAMQRAERAAEKQAEQGGPKGPAAKPKAERLEPPRRSGRQTQQVRRMWT